MLVLSPGTNYEARQKVVSRVLTVLGAEGRAIRTRPRGSWTSTQFRWAALERWQPAVRTDLEPAAARAELARRWLAAFGPATVEDLRWWAGWTLGATRAALAPSKPPRSISTARPASSCRMTPSPANAVEPWAALLPALDATTMGWKQRDWYLAEHGPLLFDRNGNASPTVWWDGRIVGGWAQATGGEIRSGCSRTSAPMRARRSSNAPAPRSAGRRRQAEPACPRAIGRGGRAGGR